VNTRRIAISVLLSFLLAACGPARNPGSEVTKSSTPTLRQALAARDRIQVDHRARLEKARDDEPTGSRLDYQPLPVDDPEFKALHYKLDLSVPAASVLEQSYDATMDLERRA
jgi:hypothetical protein